MMITESNKAVWGSKVLAGMVGLLVVSGTFTLSAQKHLVNFASGYSIALETGGGEVGFGRTLTGYMDGEELAFEEVTPRFGQGLNISLGYEYLLSDRWSLWSDLHFLHSSGYSTIDTISVWQLSNELYDFYGGIRHTEFDAKVYSGRVGVAYNFNRGRPYRRYSNQGRFYYQFKLGITCNKVGLTALSTAAPMPSQKDSVYYDTRAGGFALGATGGVKTVYRLNRKWEVYVQISADWLSYRPNRVVYEAKQWNSEDELHPFAGGFIPDWMGGAEMELKWGPVFPFHNLSAMLGVNFVF